MLLGSRSRRSWACPLAARQARQSNPQRVRVAEFGRPCNRTDHRLPVICAPRNHHLLVAPTGHVGLRRATHSPPILSELRRRGNAGANGQQLSVTPPCLHFLLCVASEGVMSVRPSRGRSPPPPTPPSPSSVRSRTSRHRSSVESECASLSPRDEY